MLSTLRLASSLLISIVCWLDAGSATAQDYPTKPIRLVVAQSAGVTADLVGRIMAPEMSKFLGQPIVVENKPGADSIIGYEYVAKQVPADGYTIVVVSVASLATLPVTVKDLRFNPLKDLAPFIGLAEGRYVFRPSSGLPWKTFKEMVAYAKANPGKLNAGASSPLTRLLMELLIQDLGLSATLVSYSAGAPYVQALLVGDVQMGFTAESTVGPMGEKFRVLAVTGEQRLATLRDAPTFAELGFPQIPGIAFTLNVPAGTPKAALDKLYAAASRALQQPDVKARFTKIGLDVTERAPEAAAKSLAETAKLFADIAKKAGIQPE